MIGVPLRLGISNSSTMGLVQWSNNRTHVWKLSAQRLYDRTIISHMAGDQGGTSPGCKYGYKINKVAAHRSFKPPKHDLGRVQSIQKWRRCAICAIECQKKHENVSRSSNAVWLILHTGSFLLNYGRIFSKNSGIIWAKFKYTTRNSIIRNWAK